MADTCASCGATLSDQLGLPLLEAEKDLCRSMTAYEEIVTMLRRVFDPDECATKGAAYDLRDPVLHAREYVQRVVQKFVNKDEFRRLANNIHLFQRREGRASEDLGALAGVCDRLAIAEALQFAASRDSVGPNPSLAMFMVNVIKVELLAEKVSGLTAELLPDLRTVPAVVV